MVSTGKTVEQFGRWVARVFTQLAGMKQVKASVDVFNSGSNVCVLFLFSNHLLYFSYLLFDHTKIQFCQDHLSDPKPNGTCYYTDNADLALDPGDTYGEVEILNGTSSLGTLIGYQDFQLMFIPKDAVLRLIGLYPGFAKEIRDNFFRRAQILR